MKYKRSITLLIIWIAFLSTIVTLFGLYSNNGPGEYNVQSIHGETIAIYGKGIYQLDSVSGAVQAIAQDLVTLILGVPLLLLSLFYSRKGSIRGRFLLIGTLGYFLYTYTSYSFLLTYNSLFLIYVTLMSASFFAFALTFISIDIKNISAYFNKKAPFNMIGITLILMGLLLLIMWVGRIIPSIINGTTPVGLENYTTLVIQALDLGFIVPLSIVTGILLIRKKTIGYLLGSILIIKFFTLSTSITVMAVNMIMANVKISNIEFAVFIGINLIMCCFIYLILKNIKE